MNARRLAMVFLAALLGGCHGNSDTSYVVWDYRPEIVGDEPWGILPPEEITSVGFDGDTMETVARDLSGFYGIEIRMPAELGPKRVKAEFGQVACVDIIRALVDEKDFVIESSDKLISIMRRGVPPARVIHVRREPAYD